MTLWKRGSVYWAIFFIDGIRIQVSTGTSNRRHAEIIAQKLKEEANLRRHQITPVDPNLTFEALAAYFMANAQPTEYHLGRLQNVLPFFGDKRVNRINRALVAEYRAYRHAKSKVGDATLNRDVAVIKHILYWAVDQSYLLANPLARVPMVRERRTRRPVLSLDEEILLLRACPEHLGRFVIAALDTGLRRGEISHQLWEDIDFGRGVLYVTRSKTPEGESREIPLTKRLFSLLWENRENEGLIFTYQGRQLRSLKTTWKTTLKRAGIRHVRFHDLRHTFNTRLMEAGVMQEVRKALMGHVSGDKVHSIYTHVELPIKREAIRKLEEWVQAQTVITLQKEVPRLGEPEVAAKHD
jgi:integrase